MKRIYLLCIMLAFAKTSHSQSSVYYKYYDILGLDALTSRAKIIQSSDSNFYYLVFVQEDSVTNLEDIRRSIVYAKLTLHGDIVWTMQIPDSSTLYFHDVSACAAPGNGLFICYCQPGSSLNIPFDLTVLKIDENGTITNTYSNNKIYSYYSNILMDNGYPYLVCPGPNGGILITKFDLNLNPIWANQYINNPYNGVYQYAMVANNGDLIIVEEIEKYSFTVMDCNSDGQVNWDKGYSFSYYDSSGNIQIEFSVSTYSGLEDAQNNFVFVGTNETINATIAKITNDGNFVFCNFFGGASFDEAYDILPEGQYNYMVIGEPESFTKPFHSMTALQQFDLDGNLQWTKIYGDTAIGTFPYGGVSNSDGTYTIFGINGHFNNVSDIYLMKIAADGVSACKSLSVTPFDSSLNLTTTTLSVNVTPYSHDSTSSIIIKAIPVNTFTVCDSIVFPYNSGTPQLFLPSAFTPGKETNGYFHLLNPQDVTNLVFNIYNRWGQLVFTSNNLNFMWDGTFRGKPQPMDTYVWWMSYETSQSSTKQIQKGDVTLIR